MSVKNPTFEKTLILIIIMKIRTEHLSLLKFFLIVFFGGFLGGVISAWLDDSLSWFGMGMSILVILATSLVLTLIFWLASVLSRKMKSN